MALQTVYSQNIMHTHLRVSLQIVVEHVHGNSEVSCVKWIFAVPALRTELPPLCNARVEITQREQDGLELLFPRTLVQDVLHTRNTHC